MEVVPAMSDVSPFQRRDVAEWTHRDRLTGMVETARVETDRWASTSSTAKHAYGKVVDSRNRSLPDGSAHQRQRQQLEVFQTKGPGGSLQVIRTQTVTSTNSSSSWRGGVASAAHSTALPAITQDFEDLQLTLNPLDLSSEKSKASVGRSGSISSRRPPSRPRSLVGRVAPTTVARACNDSSTTISEAASTDGRQHSSSTTSSKSSSVNLNGHLGITRKKSSSIEDLHNGVPEECEDTDDGLRRSSKVRRSLQFPLKKLEARGGVCKLLQELEESSKRNVTEGRIARRSFEALENVLKRNNSLTDSSNPSEREDGERQRDYDDSNTESDQYNHHSVNSVSIDDFARKFNSSRSKFILEKRHSLMDTLDKSFLDNEDEKSPVSESKNLSKRHSFVTVESLKEVRGRLKRLNSPLDGLDTESGMEELDDHDDGIGTDETSKLTGSSITEIPQLRVKSYVYGIEGISRSPRPPVLGTGSLESRTSNKSSASGSRSDEWYNRRKSYGFESVHGEEPHTNSSALTCKYDETNRLTSTDSGICRSSDQFAFPSWKRKQQETDSTKPSETEILQVSHSIPLSKTHKEISATTSSTNRENVRRGRTTVVTFGSKTGAQDAYSSKEVETLHRNGDSERTQTAYPVKKTIGNPDDRARLSGSQPMTVSIPILPDEAIPSVVSRRLFFQQLSQGTSGPVDKPWNQQATKNDNQSPSLIGSRKVDGDDWWRKSPKLTTGYPANGQAGNEDWQASSKLTNSVMKRHSIAVDSSWKSFNNLNKSVHENLSPAQNAPSEDGYRGSQSADESKRHSIAVDKLTYPYDEEGGGYGQPPREDTDNFVSRKQKRVEFCKTEVHFAAEPGRINIVETDEKPPPTNMFRRRRRHSTPASDAAKNAGNLPEVRFGDSVYEKQLLGGTEEMEGAGGAVRPSVLPVRVREEVYHVDTNIGETSVVEDDDEQCHFESSLEPTPRSILKNFKKPKPYLIGENEDGYTSIDDQKEEKWGVRLRPVAPEQPAPWRCATGLSPRDEVMPTEYSGQSELQKLLRSLRPANSNRAKASILFPQSQKREEKTSECSVAERVRLVEQVASESKGFSTRVNFGAGEATVVDQQQDAPSNQRLYKASEYPKPVWQRREENIVNRGTSASELPDEAPPRTQQRSTATTILPSYTDCDRLRAVDTLVSTRSGHPKITSIKLRYGEDDEPTKTRNTDAFKFTSKTSISPDRVNASCNVEDKAMTSTYSKTSFSPQTYPLSTKVAPARERSVGVSRTRLGASVEKKERRTIFDRADVIATSILEPERRSLAKQSDAPPRGLSFSHFEKKPLNAQKSQSPTSRPSDSLTTAEVITDRSTFAKQLLHSEPTFRSATISSVDKHATSKVSSTSVSKQSTSQTITTNPQNSSSSLVNSKTTSSFERKVSNPSNSIRSPSPRNSRLSYQPIEAHRSSPRSRGSSESQSGVKLDAITTTTSSRMTSSSLQQRDLKDLDSITTGSNSKMTSNSLQQRDAKDFDAVTTSSTSRMTSSSLQQRDAKEKTGTVKQHASESNEKPQCSIAKTDRLTNDPSSVNTGKSTLVGRESRRVTRSTSKSPTPNKKVTPPSKNSKTKDFIGRAGSDSPTYQNSKNSTSPSNTLSTSANVRSSTVTSRSDEQHSQFPAYQNSGMVYDEPLEASNLSNKPESKRYDSGLDLIETDSAILEELTRAADQILQAVNGYTDEESRRASSDDDSRRYKERRSTTLGTISESPLRKQVDLTASHKTNGAARRTQRVSSKTKLGPTSSTSSVESFTRETRRALVKTERSSGAATSSRTARMVQRANSRELLLQTNASSSEDIASGTESSKKQRAPPPRRTRASSSSNKDPSSSSTRSKDRLKDTVDGSRTKERVSASRGKSRDTSDSREASRKLPETKHHPVKEKTIPAASGLTGGRERSSHARHSTTSTRSAKVSNNQEKTATPKRRSDSAVQT